MDYITCQKSLFSFYIVIINKCSYFLNIGVSYNIAVAASINNLYILFSGIPDCDWLMAAFCGFYIF